MIITRILNENTYPKLITGIALISLCLIFGALVFEDEFSDSSKAFLMDKLDKKSKLYFHFRGRLGNEMFGYTAALCLAVKSGHYPYIVAKRKGISGIQKVFRNLTVPFTTKILKSSWVRKRDTNLYDDHFITELKKIPSIQLTGYFATWRYCSGMEDTVRKEFEFKTHLQNTAFDFLSDIRKKIRHTNTLEVPKEKITLVGIHVRRGDFLTKPVIRRGWRIAPKIYFDKATEYFRRMYKNVHFVICSNDKKWCSENLNYSDATLSNLTDRDKEFAILANCDHMIMSVGTFGWWAAWLTGGQVAYFGNITTPGTDAHSYGKNLSNIYPSSWKAFFE